jgi:hypothetical protein
MQMSARVDRIVIAQDRQVAWTSDCGGQEGKMLNLFLGPSLRSSLTALALEGCSHALSARSDSLLVSRHLLHLHGK